MITAVVITARGGHFLNSCIHSIRMQTHTVHNIIVVHSFPITGHKSGVQYIQTKGYLGYAHAVNQGLRCVKTPFFFVLNDDTILHRECVSELSKHLHPYTIIQPQIRQLDQPNLIENTGHWITKDGFNLARGRGQPASSSFPSSIMVFSGAAFCGPLSMTRKVGFMDEDLFSFGEDLDWSLRSIRHGYKIYYASNAIVFHKLGATHSREGFSKGKWVERNRISAIIRSWPKELILRSPFFSLQRLIRMTRGAYLGTGLVKNSPFSTAIGALFGYSESITTLSKSIQKRTQDQRNWDCDDDEFLDMIEKNTPPNTAL